MNFKFTINKNHLLYKALTSGVNMDGWVDLQNELWEKHNLGYKFMQGKVHVAFSSNDTEKYLKAAIKDMNKMFEIGMKSKLFKQLLLETKQYKKWLENEWDANKDKVRKELTDILKIDLPKQTATVLVVSNKMKSGQHLGDKLISWGHSEDWENYSLVYLAHEFLHGVLPSSSTAHAVIELATDNELRLRLNSSGKYFYINKELIGHDYLYELEKKLLPDWKKFLKSKDRTVFDFIEKHT